MVKSEIMAYQFYTADVFTNRLFGGNPLAVFPEASGLETSQMQQIAREFNLSETVFVFPPTQPHSTKRLRIFTPQAEIPFAGHPTVGTAYILATIGAFPLVSDQTEIIFEEGVGPVPVTITSKEGKPTYTELTAAMKPQFSPAVVTREELAALLSLEIHDCLDEAEVVSCGVPFLFIPIRSLAAVEKLSLNYQLWETKLAGTTSAHIYVFTRETALETNQIHARMFAPALGVPEDPATGAAATALAGYLSKRVPQQEGVLTWQVEQGWEMGRPSLLQVKAELAGGNLEKIRVGGATVLVSEGKLFLS